MATTQEFCPTGAAPEKRRIGKRLEEIAWAVFLIMTGGLWLAPATWIPEGTWLAGLGLILLGLNAARRFHGLRINGFGVAAGIASLAAGIGRVLGFAFPWLPILLVGLGTAMVIKAVAKPGNSDEAARAS